MRGAVAVVGVAMVCAAGGVAALVSTADATASCAVKMTVSGPHNGKLVLAPSTAKVATGACMSVVNATALTLKVSISHSGATVYGPADLAKGATSSPFTPTSNDLGSNVVTASAQTILSGLLPTTVTGTLTVTKPVVTSPSASTTPSGQHTTKPKHPQVAPSPKHKHAKKTAQPLPTGITLPPLPPLPSDGVSALPSGTNPRVAAEPTTAAPTVSTSSSPAAAIIAGPIEPTGGADRGLPIAVGVVVALGLATGWGRVLLAAPAAVDERPRGHHRL